MGGEALQIEIPCAICGADRTSTRYVYEELKLPDATLQISVPVRSCEACGGRFTDAAAEDIRSRAATLYRFDVGTSFAECLVAMRLAGDRRGAIRLMQQYAVELDGVLVFRDQPIVEGRSVVRVGRRYVRFEGVRLPEEDRGTDN